MKPRSSTEKSLSTSRPALESVETDPMMYLCPLSLESTKSGTEGRTFGFSSADDSGSGLVHLAWASSSGATSYRIERSIRLSEPFWGPLTTVGTTSYNDTVPSPSPSQPVVTYLYRVVALAGTAASPASALDYATTASTLFAEGIMAGSTIIKGSHVKELRNAIDAVRISSGLLPSSSWTGWPASYTPATGPVLAAHVGAMRVALDEALFTLKHTHLPTTANPSGTILAVHYNDLRAGVK